MTGLWVVLGTLVLGVVAGFLLRSREGRIRQADARAEPVGATLPAEILDTLRPEHPVTLVQISTTFCSPCRQARARLSALAERTEGLGHTELDVTHRPEIAHRLGVMRTPTTIAFNPQGRELLRVGGVPESRTLLDALRYHLQPTPGSSPR